MNFIEGMVLAGVFPQGVEFQGISEGADWQPLPSEPDLRAGVGSKVPAVTYRKRRSAWPLGIVLILAIIGLGILVADKSSPADIPEKDRIKVSRSATPASSSNVPTPGEDVYTDATGRSYRLSREDYNRLYQVKMRLNTMERTIEEKAKKLKATQDEVDLKKKSLSPSDTAAVDAYNQLVALTKKLDAELESELRVFEVEAPAFNKELERVGRPIR
ncbi:hypothetical protein [Verrucomicrobium spinosum]|uniref:hypothetical protein n=1 Tax=Verrucomicrobium spinosum TaxID=2736 RepID=UPI000ADB7CB5|nr:hypothetical protein [Verrucomicrobium spinosum]